MSTKISREDAAEMASIAEELNRRERTNAMLRYRPYDKQALWHMSMKNDLPVIERILFAGTQSGKSYAAAMETAYHMTGRYPDWWVGRRFDHAPQGWAGGQSYQALRASAQQKLLGTETPFSTPHLVGTGAIPKECVVKITATRGIPDSVDTLIVRHTSGDYSTLTFKTYEMHQNKWAGSTLDFIWLDEEPPMNIYIEALGRVTVRKGLLYTTFTPLSGRTPLTDRFLSEDSPERLMVRMTLYEVGHKKKEEVDALLANYPEWEREARIYGLPAAGHGRIITLMESHYVIEPIPLQPWWPRIIGLDIGTIHPTAAICIAHDRDTNRLLVYNEYAKTNLKIQEHAANLLMMGAGQFPVAWPHDANERDKGDLVAISKQYKKFGCHMLDKHAQTYDTAIGSTLWSSVMDMINRLTSHQLKIFSTCTELRAELMDYHQKDGQIVKVRDDHIAALRYGIMCRARAKVPDFSHPLERAYRKSSVTIAKDADMDPFW